MNLIDLVTRQDARLAVPQGTEIGRRSWGGESWRCLKMPADGSPLRLTSFMDTHSLWTRPDHLGWYAAVGAKQKGQARLHTVLRRGTDILAERVVPLPADPMPVFLPWPVPPVPLGDDTVLEISADGTAEGIDLLVQRALDRKKLYALAGGNGVEIGPGPRPQIHPSDTVSVTYVEETPPEEWVKLYDRHGKYNAAEADWSNIQIGKAADLPVEDASLDFIFSSHVFEHLSNPLGHLERWRAKMRPGGVVMAVVPDLTSTKDRFMRPCPREEFVEEYDSAAFEPLLRHYRRYVRRLTEGQDDPARAGAMMANNESIHIHFYDRPTIAWLLAEAVDRFGYDAFHLEHARNHKDFHFVLRA